MTTLHSIITIVGKNKLAAAVAAGTALELTHIALGDGARRRGRRNATTTG